VSVSELDGFAVFTGACFPGDGDSDHLIGGLPRRRRRWSKNFRRREALPMVVGERGGVERKHSD